MTDTRADIDCRMMKRALQIATNGRYGASPNPMVGAVIADSTGTIIGEGWHRQCGSHHAEVNAVADCPPGTDFSRLAIYVTLEPCSHYGKTPPCSKLLVDRGFKRVVIATLDPFEKVAGRGAAMLRDAGIEVDIGLLADEARALNRRFFTAHTQHRPFITLKWAQSADGFIDGRDNLSASPARISTPTGMTAVHKLRALHDAIMVGDRTLELDHPRLDVRVFAGRSPKRIPPTVDMEALYKSGITSLLVEGGAQLLNTFLEAGLWDAVRIETNPRLKLGHKPYRVAAPTAPTAPHSIGTVDNNIVTTYLRT